MWQKITQEMTLIINKTQQTNDSEVPLIAFKFVHYQRSSALVAKKSMEKILAQY